MLSIVLLSIVMLNLTFKLSMLSVVILNVIMLSVVAPTLQYVYVLECHVLKQVNYSNKPETAQTNSLVLIVWH